MNNSRGGQPQTLSLPKPDFISHNMPRNGFTTSVSVETSSFKPESSIEFDIPEGASPLARFGMDIGGTLCKVVYFEPARPLYSSCMKHVVNIVQDDTTRLVEGKGSLFESEKPSEDEYTGQTSLNGEETHKQFDTSFAQSIAITENDVHIEIKPASGKLQESQNKSVHQITSAEGGRQANCSQGCMNFNGTRTSLGALTGERPKERVHSTSYPISNIRKIWVSSHVPVDLPGCGTLHFKCFETWRIEEFLKLSREHSLVTPGRAIGATGGGARKFFDKFFDIAGLRLQHYDELKSLVRGIDFLVRNAQHESFEYPMGSYKAGLIQRPWKSPDNSSDDDDNNSCHRDNGRQNIGNKNSTNVHSDGDGIENSDGGQNARTIAENCVPKIDGNSVLLDGSHNLYPYLVVNIGSGVSILRVDSPDKFQRVGGTSLGGSTFLGLASALTGCNSFEEAVNLAMRGDSTQIDMLVGDIYGGDYTEMGLAATTVASSFGKLVEPAKRDAAMKTPEHLAKAILLMITNNIGSIAMLHSRAAGVDHVLFTGSFLRGNKVATRLLAVAMEFWSKGLIKAIFLRHEGHAGAVGAMLYGLDPTSEEDAILLV